MKSFLKNSKPCLLALAFVSVCAALPAGAQTREEHFISAKAGGVNYVSGDVKARRAGDEDWRGVSVKDNLGSGDAARTGADGRVEVLLNPGSYLRAGASTEFELVNSSLDDLRVRLARGSVLVEATGYGDLDLDIEVATPQTRVHIVRSGVYRLDVTPSGETVVSVQKGRARVGEGAAALVVKGGKTARVGAGGVEVAKLDKKQRDDLDLWSRDRGKELAKLNDALASRQTNTMLASLRIDPIYSAEFPSSYYGLWMWSVRRGCYTFLPFYTGWRSPYGFGYGSFFSPFYYNCWNCAPRHNTQPVIVRNNGGAGGSPNPITHGGGPSPTSSGGGSPAGGGRVISPPPSPAPAPVERIERPMRERTIEPGYRP
jgi:hypothetical protein